MCKKLKNIMGILKKLFDINFVGGKTNEEVYPITHVKGVFDDDNKSLEDVLKNVNSNIEALGKAVETIQEDVQNLPSVNNSVNPLNSKTLYTESGKVVVSDTFYVREGINITPFFQRGYRKNVFGNILEFSDAAVKHIILPFDTAAEGNIHLANSLSCTYQYEDTAGSLTAAKAILFCNKEGAPIKEYAIDKDNNSVIDVFGSNLISNIPAGCAYIIINLDIRNTAEIKLLDPLGLPLSDLYFPNYIVGLCEYITNITK
jgi:hypothetical protein